jgi:hypothetical protein
MVSIFRICKKNNISFINGAFIVEGVVGERTHLDKALYEKLSKPPLLGRTPFANEVTIHFKNGQSFDFLGGPRSKEELES